MQAMTSFMGSPMVVCRLTGEKTYGREVGYCVTSYEGFRQG